MSAVVRSLAAFVAVVTVARGVTSARAGPLEARARWKEAQALENAPWRERVVALRAVRREAVESDSYAPRSLLAEAKVLRAAGYGAAANAAEATAARLGPRRDPDRLGHALTAARALLAEGDGRGARFLLDDVVESGGGAAPAFTGPAIALLGRLASDARDDGALARLVRLAADAVPASVDVRLSLLDLQGMRAFRDGDRVAAQRALDQQRRLFDAARREGGGAERVASSAWLSLALPATLDGR